MYLKRLVSTTVVIVLLAFILIGCAPAQIEQEDLSFGADFSIDFLANDAIKVTDGEDREVLLVPRGQTPPPEYADLPVIEVPVERVLLTSTTQASLIRPLNVWEQVGGVSNPLDQWFVPEVTEGLNDGTISFVGEAWSPDYEQIRLLDPDLVFVYTGEFGLQDMMGKLDEMGIPFVVVNDHLESTPQNEIEWTIFMSTFFGKLDEAQEYVNLARENIEEIAARVEGFEAPRVSWGFLWDGQAHIPNAGSMTAAMIEAAGGIYIFNDIGEGQGGTSTISLEEFYARSKEADVLIYSSMLSFVPSVQAIIDQAPILADIQAISDDNVWAFSPEYFQMIHRRYAMINDLASIFYPQEFEIEGLYVKMPRNQ